MRKRPPGETLERDNQSSRKMKWPNEAEMFGNVVVKKQSTLFCVIFFWVFAPHYYLYDFNHFFLQITRLRKTRFVFSVLCCLS